MPVFSENEFVTTLMITTTVRLVFQYNMALKHLTRASLTGIQPQPKPLANLDIIKFQPRPYRVNLSTLLMQQ